MDVFMKGFMDWHMAIQKTILMLFCLNSLNNKDVSFFLTFNSNPNMTKKGIDKYMNKITGSSSLYETQKNSTFRNCSPTSKSAINVSEKYNPEEAAKT